MSPRPHSLRRFVGAAVAIVLIVAGLTHSTPAGADGPPAPGPDKDGWRALFDGKSLAGWTASDFFKAGRVHVKDGSIVMEAGKVMTGITFAGKDFPQTDYEVTFEAKKLDGNDFFCTTTFPVGDDACSLVVGGWGGSLVGLSSIDGQDASQNETQTTKEFERDKWYRVRIRVAKPRIAAWIDTDKVVDFDTTDRRISIRIECQPSRPFGIATYETTGAVRDIRVRRLNEADKKAAADKKPDGKK